MTEPTRAQRRKTRTRGALIAAAQGFLAEGTTDVSIQEITDRADVGFGSFYNHFSSKEELWAAAIDQTLAAHGALVASLTAAVDDPAETFCIGVRLTGRLHRFLPEVGRVLVHTGIAELLRDQGLADYALEDLRACIDAGRFDIVNPELALAVAAGALLGVLHHLAARPEADVDAVADETALRLLIAFGLRRAEAGRIVGRPLPEPAAGGLEASAGRRAG